MSDFLLFLQLLVGQRLLGGQYPIPRGSPLKKKYFIYDVQMAFSVYRPPTSGINVLTNPGFEQPLVNDPVKGWSCQGETDDPRGGVIARYTRHQAKEGQHSGICLARLSEWAGPGQYIGKVLVRQLLIVL